MGEKIINMKNEKQNIKKKCWWKLKKGCHVVKTTINLCIIVKEIGRVNLAINERGLVGYEELGRSRRVLSEVDNSLRGLLDSSYPTKAEFINYFIIHSKSFLVQKHSKNMLTCIDIKFIFDSVRL